MAPDGQVGLLSRCAQACNAAIIALLPATEQEGVLAGTTDLPGLGAAPLLFFTDLGPVYVANAVGTPVVVCLEPGNEHNTGFYHPARAAVVERPAPPVPCGSCRHNQCQFNDVLPHPPRRCPPDRHCAASTSGI